MGGREGGGARERESVVYIASWGKVYTFCIIFRSI